MLCSVHGTSEDSRALYCAWWLKVWFTVPVCYIALRTF